MQAAAGRNDPRIPELEVAWRKVKRGESNQVTSGVLTKATEQRGPSVQRVARDGKDIRGHEHRV
jgi:hypothetical protein